MRHRDLLILTLVAVFGLGIGLVLITDDSHATVDLTPSGAPTEIDEPLDPDVPEVPSLAHSTGNPAAVIASSGGPRIDTTGWKSGIVRGDIRLAVSVLDRIETMTVIVEELRTAGGSDSPPHRITVPVERGIGTPTFEVRNIPFSDHPYAVRVYSPGLNGAQRTVTIDPQTPLHDDIVLTITPGRPFSVLVRDQDSNPYPLVDVRLFAVGEPRGRGEHIGQTDGYGSAVFESVLSGDYRLVVGMKGIPLAEPEIITVQRGARIYGNKIQGQGHSVIVQRGVRVQVAISDRGGYGVEQAKVKLQASDRVKLTVFDSVTDFGGKAEFPHVTPGKWMITVTKQNYTPFTKQITITDGQLPEFVKGKINRLR